MMRRAGVEVKSPAIIYVIGAFLDRHFWTEMSRRHTTIPRNLDDREASRDSPPVTLVGHSFGGQPSIANRARPSQKRRHKTAAKCR
jgi:hypothetical protein